MRRFFLVIAIAALPFAVGFRAEAAARTIDQVYPGLLRGSLSSAVFGRLPDGALARSGGMVISAAEIEALIARSPAPNRPELRKNALFLVQELVTKRLLAYDAKLAAQKRGERAEGLPEADLISRHLQSLAGEVAVSEDEMAAFYAANIDMFEGAPLAKVQSTLRAYLRKAKRQKRVDHYVSDLGRRYSVVVAAEWGARQAALAMDNPLDRARLSGRPTLIQFSAPDCSPCEKMAPFVEKLRKQYAGRANILTIKSDVHKLLATRFGITIAPTQVFFSAKGDEAYRNIGFLSREDTEAQLAKLGVR